MSFRPPLPGASISVLHSPEVIALSSLFPHVECSVRTLDSCFSGVVTSESSEAAYLFRRKKRTLRPLFPALLYNMTFTIKNDFLLTRLSTNVNYYVLHTLLITYVCTYLIHVIIHFLYIKYFAINFCGCAKTRTIDIAMQHLTNNGKSIEQTNS